MKARTFWIVLAIIFLIGVGIRIVSTKRETEGVEESSIPVHVEIVTKGDIEEVISLTGNIKGESETLVAPKVTGKLVVNKVKEGDRVNKGDVLSVVDRDMPGMRYEPAFVKSPIKGIVGRVYLDAGSEVAPPQPPMSKGTPVALIVAMENVRVDVNIPEQYAGRVSKGDVEIVKCDAYPNKAFKGKVTRVAPVLDQITRTQFLELTIPNRDYLLKPGMFATVYITIQKSKDVVVIPNDAIQGIGENRYVFIVRNGKAKRVPVKVGIINGNRAEIIEGISPGDSLITVGSGVVYDGSDVIVTSSK